MNTYLYCNALISLLSFVGFIYGIVTVIKTTKALYYIMIIASVGTTAFSRLYEAVHMWITEEYFDGFHIGIIGNIASFLFIFTANYGVMDSLGDDKSPRFRKYRLIALSADAVLLGLYIPILLSDASFTIKLCYGLIFVMMMCSSYYNLKHLILPDVDYGIIRCIKGYNFIMLCYTLLFALERIALVYDMDIVLYIASVGIAIASVLTIPVLRKGVLKWTI